MIHSARPIVTPLANIVFCCFVFLYLNGRTTCAKTIIPTGRDFRLAEWINKTVQMPYYTRMIYGDDKVMKLNFHSYIDRKLLEIRM